MRQLAVGHRTIEEGIKRIRTLFASAGKTTDTREQLDILQRLAPSILHALYQQLIEPVAELLHNARHILVVADGLLYSLPLELLVTHYDAAQQQRFQDDTRQAGRKRPWLSQFDDLPYLGAHYRFCLPAKPGDVSATTPAATTTAFFGEVQRYSPETQQQLTLIHASRGAAVDHLPRLPETAREVEEIARLVGGKTRSIYDTRRKNLPSKNCMVPRSSIFLWQPTASWGGEFLLWNEPGSTCHRRPARPSAREGTAYAGPR